MRIVIPGGTGQIGRVLDRALTAEGHDVLVLTRRPRRDRELSWDGRTLGRWAEAVDGSDAVINLAGRSVNCRYTPANQHEMLASRVDSTRVVGEAVAAAARPPRVWLQMSTATIYAHHYGTPHDEATGVLGGGEPDVPRYWDRSTDIAKAWERTQQDAPTPDTRRVALRTAMVMSPDRGGAFDLMLRLARCGLGGPIDGGAQYMSWIHDRDLVRAVRFLLDRDDLAGPVNLAAPHPVPQRAFMQAIRRAWGIPVGLPATRRMAELGAFALRSDTELLLKSRSVTPGRLRDAGFGFEHPHWPAAAVDLARRLRQRA
ncbi:TIGR01777 family oxidoreductase [Streptomyces sp. CB01881]|uniref:TIGR01777 family oxidoreductase n=1 Tax=Streptomyces sp. CB01881 TaxID=2078691 RepID=UPI000CDC3673|nr:TIGR01777 family oxidoreductase [Streptomyces sp. CB01881]AUY52950.1 TIGR01777 family protein [Streptomyces sp. CB01881]TYC70666.1 TIGR01777 family protein [Streptomyces sp. CB01881]